MFTHSSGARRTRSRRITRLAVVAAATAAVTLSGCASGGDGGGDGEMPTVTISMTQPSLSFAAALVAQEEGLFEKEGVKAEIQLQESGATALQSLIGGSANFGIVAATDAAGAAAKNAELTTIYGLIKMTQQVCISDRLYEERGLSDSSTVEERIKALKGVAIGISKPGASSDRAMRWLLSNYGDIDPDRDVQMISVGGSGYVSALEAGQTDAYLNSPPSCAGLAQQGKAHVLLVPTEIEQFGNSLMQVVTVQNDYLKNNEDTVVKVLKALNAGQQRIADDPDGSLESLKQSLRGVDDEVLRAQLTDNIQPQQTMDGLMSEELWENTARITVDVGLADKLDITEGVFWTNEYAEKAAG